jgi:hypothetical protein
MCVCRMAPAGTSTASHRSPEYIVAFDEFTSDVVAGKSSAAGFSFEDIIFASLFAKSNIGNYSVANLISELVPELGSQIPAALRTERFTITSLASALSYKSTDAHATPFPSPELDFMRDLPLGAIMKPSTIMRPGIISCT